MASLASERASRRASDLARSLAPALTRGDAVAWARYLIALPSVNPALAGGADRDLTGEARVADVVARALAGWGFQVARHEPEPGRVSLWATFGSGTPVLGLCGHLDTVGVEAMAFDPFDPAEVEVADGVHLRGRGSADMKAGVAAILAAAAAVARDPGAFRGTLHLFLTADEEHASLGLAHLLGPGGIAALDPPLEGVVVPEPTELALAPANKGFAWFRVEARGRAAHGSRPEVGRDAIRQMARVLAALDEPGVEEALVAGGTAGGTLPGGMAHPLLGQGSLHAGTIQGGEAPSVYPARCTLELEVRLLPGVSVEAVEAGLVALVRRVEADHPGVSLAVDRTLDRPGAELLPDHPLVHGVRSAVEAEGLSPRLEPMTAWVESAWFMEAGIPALCLGPGSLGAAHRADESVPVDEIRQAARILERWVRHPFGPNPSGQNPVVQNPADQRPADPRPAGGPT